MTEAHIFWILTWWYSLKFALVNKFSFISNRKPFFILHLFESLIMSA